MSLITEAVAPVMCGDPVTEAAAPTNRLNARLLIVDDEPAQRKVLATIVEQAGMSCKTVPNAEQALTLLQREPVDAVIADLLMPGISGFELLREVRKLHPRLVFLLATGAGDVRLGIEAMQQGADDYLVKPLQLDELLVSLDRAFDKKHLEHEVENYRQNLEKIVCERTVQLQNAVDRVGKNYADVLDALGDAIDLRDGRTGGHSRRVALCSIEILERMGGSRQELRNLAMGAWLHDIGKLAISDAILLKPGPLTEEERRVIEGHVMIGYDWIKRIPFLAGAAEIILTHHERWDGSGYPRGLKGHEIPLSSRIFAIADTVDAMMSDRPYRSALPSHKAWDEVERQAGIQFDPRVVGTFLKVPREVWDTLRKESSALQISSIFAGISLEHPYRIADFADASQDRNE